MKTIYQVTVALLLMSAFESTAAQDALNGDHAGLRSVIDKHQQQAGLQSNGFRLNGFRLNGKRLNGKRLNGSEGTGSLVLSAQRPLSGIQLDQVQVRLPE